MNATRHQLMSCAKKIDPIFVIFFSPDLMLGVQLHVTRFWLQPRPCLRNRNRFFGGIMKHIFLNLILFMTCATSGWANVVGTDIQNFNPTTSGLDFVTVQSSETLDTGVVNVGLFLNYAVNTMPNYENQTSQSRTDFEDTMLGVDLNVGLGLARNWDVGISVPQVIAETHEDNTGVFQGRIAETGISEYRVNTKYRFWGDDIGGLAAVFTVNFDQVTNNPFTGHDAGPTYNAELAWDTTSSARLAYGVNLGYRMRDPGTPVVGIPVQPFRDQYIASAAVSYWQPANDIKWVGEIFGSFPAEDSQATTDRDLSSVELLLGAKKDLRHDLSIHAGGGTEVYHGSGSPDWRVYTGINWNFGPLWNRPGADDNRLDSADESFFNNRQAGPKEKFVAGDVLFAFNSAELSPAFQQVLKQLVKYLERGKGFKNLTIEGHTDSVGPEAYNLKLSLSRADSVKKFLIETGGLSADKLNSVGFGEERPVADNSNYQGRAKNRRVEFAVTR